MLEVLSGWKGAVTTVTAAAAPTGRAALYVEPGEVVGGTLESAVRSASGGLAAPGQRLTAQGLAGQRHQPPCQELRLAAPGRIVYGPILAAKGLGVERTDH